MRLRRWIIVGGLVVIAAGVGAYLPKPVEGPERDLSLQPDAERGAYVMTVGGCIACHTDLENDGPALGGGEPLQTAFGDFIPPNITPDPEAGIGEWTLQDFSEAMSDGMGPGAMQHLYPSFPYDNYTLMTDQDIVDLYAALQEVEPVGTPAGDHRVSFPFNMRVLLAGWKTLFFEPRRFEPDPNRSDAWNRGKYLANGPGHCTACHTPRNALGARDDSRAFEGSSGTPGGNVPGITGAQLADEGYDHAGLVEALKTGFTPGFDVLGGPMGEVISESTSQWTDADLDAIATYLLDEQG